MLAKFTALGAITVGALAASPALAQSQPSGDEILGLLNRQQAAASANSVAAQSANRGISVTYGGDAATGQPRDVAAAPAQPARQTPRATPAALPSEPPVVDSDQQVNLQITFETNSAFIRPGQQDVLVALCDALNKAPGNWSFNIVGHADAAGDDTYNLRLSQARAREVRRYLSTECGVSAARLNVYGVGERRPLPGVPAISEQNRRVEIQYSAS